MARNVHVVPHTHWDREWYKPYPLFRMQLVELLDGLLPRLETDEGYSHFQLDGQLAVIDDYLEIRPLERDRIAALNRAGRISFGPWYTLPDEFLVSGETLVRNLRLGLATAEAFGGSMQVGYLPDMFGHVAQMPQILAGFGFADAVVWRGVPAAVTTPAFTWVAPDGTAVRAEYLSDGYSNGARLPDSGSDLVEQVDAFVAAQGSLVGESILWMNGTDHQLPQPHLPRVVAEANETGGDYRFAIGSLTEHLATAERRDLPEWHGEMRSGARTNLLMGVASCRVDVKQAAARAERALERVAEPLAAVWLAGPDHPRAFLDHAWRDVIRNAAHDSICGCSADEVNDAVLHRYAESTRIAEAITDRALIRALASSAQAAIAVNPTARPRSGTVTAVVPGDVPPPHTQQVSIRPALERFASVSGRQAEHVVMRAVLEDPKASDAHLAQSTDGSGDWVATVLCDRGPRVVDAQALRGRLRELAASQPDATVHVERVRRQATQEVLLRNGPVPGFGWRGLSPDELGDHAVRPEGLGLTNGIVTVLADQTDGTFSIDGLAGFGRLVDGGDDGDTYNWNPPEFDQIIGRPRDVDVFVSEAGPVRGTIEITATYRLPEAVRDGHRRGEVETVVVTTVEIHAGEDLVRVSVGWENRSADHRLRLHMPLPHPAATSEAECAFGTVTRPLTAEGGPTEEPLATFPSRRFVSVGGLTVAHEGLCEYELVDVADDDSGDLAHGLAVTLLRSVSMISKPPMAMRPVPAGPHTPTPGAQLLGRQMRCELVLHLGGRDPYAVADEAFTPILTARRPGGTGLGDPSARFAPLTVTGAEVTALDRRSDGRIEIRLVDTTGAPSTVAITDASGSPATGLVTDLRGEPTAETFDGTTELRPFGILNLALG